MEHIGKILPVHGYRVQKKASLPVDYVQSLIHLYQPLIGLEAVSLYLTLLQEEALQKNDDVLTHHLLMNQLGLSLPSIYQARKKLEAIGLMRTFEREDDDAIVFTYELIPPFRPGEFFQDMMLSELLFQHIGQSTFNRLQTFYAGDEQKENNGKDISASFQEVFRTVTPRDGAPTNPVPKAVKQETIAADSVDFTPLKQSLEKNMIDPNKVLTETNKRYIVQLMTLYHLATYEIEKALQWALTEENTLDVEQLKQACHDLFQQKHHVAHPKLIEQTSELQTTPVVTNINNEQQTKEEQLIQKLETISPQQLLVDLSSGNVASEQDMKMVRDIMTSQGIPAPVMNVIIHYVMLQSNMQLSKPYMTTIASHWSRIGLKTAREAMAFAKSEVKKRTENIERKTNNRKYYQPKSKEIIPEWFKEKQQAQQTNQSKTKEKTETDDKEREAMLALLRQHANK